MAAVITDPSEMTPNQINKSLDRLDTRISKLMDQMIATGRGDERPSEYLKKPDPLSQEIAATFDVQRSLRNEITRRYGPGAPVRLPKGFKHTPVKRS